MDDKSLGYTIMFVAALTMVAYFVWTFSPMLGTFFSWLSPYADWAFRLPILLAVYLVLFIVLWIGYTMATTPPPIPLDNPLDLENEDESERKSSDS